MSIERGSSSAEGKPGVAKRTLAEAWKGIVGNAAWGLLVLIAIGGAAFLKGTVPVVIFLIAVILAVAFGGFVAAAAERRAIRLEAERDEARKRVEESTVELQRQHKDAADRLTQVRTNSEQAIRELREQVATATGGQSAISIRWQGIIRQLGALAQSGGGNAPPSDDQRALLVALADDFNEEAGGNDALAARIAIRWSEDGTESDFLAALNVLQARAVSLGTQEALMQ